MPHMYCVILGGYYLNFLVCDGSVRHCTVLHDSKYPQIDSTARAHSPTMRCIPLVVTLLTVKSLLQ